LFYVTPVSCEWQQVGPKVSLCTEFQDVESVYHCPENPGIHLTDCAAVWICIYHGIQE